MIVALSFSLAAFTGCTEDIMNTLNTSETLSAEDMEPIITVGYVIPRNEYRDSDISNAGITNLVTTDDFDVSVCVLIKVPTDEGEIVKTVYFEVEGLDKYIELISTIGQPRQITITKSVDDRGIIMHHYKLGEVIQEEATNEAE